MESPELETIKQMIATEIVALRSHILKLEDVTKPISPDKALGRLTRMEGLNDKGVREHALRNAQEKLFHLEQAMDRTNKPGFGICIRCRNPIPMERIMAMPEANRCVRCV